MNTELVVAIGVLIVFLIGYMQYKKKQQLTNPIPSTQTSHPKLTSTLKADLTLKDLSQYNGQTRPQIFIALKGVIYDVTSSEFYRKPSGYAMFAGHDASVSLAKMSHNQSDLDQWGKVTLVGEEVQTLEDWVARFQAKYPVVGNVKE